MNKIFELPFWKWVDKLILNKQYSLQMCWLQIYFLVSNLHNYILTLIYLRDEISV